MNISQISRGKFFVLTSSVIVGVLAVVGVVSAATTIGTSIQTDGTLSATGTTTLIGNVGIGNASPQAILDIDSNHDFQFLPSNTYGTGSMQGTAPAISTKYAGLYMGLASGDPSYGIDVNPIVPGNNGTRILSYSQTGFCFTAGYPTIDCPIIAYGNGTVSIGTAFAGQSLAGSSLFVQSHEGVGTIALTSTVSIEGTSTSPTLPLLDIASSTGTSVLRITAAGNVGIGTANPTLGPLQMASGAYVTSGGTWTNASDRNLKENFATVTPLDILSKIDSLPITEWNYKAEAASVKHIGPVAQDFYAIFNVGNASTSISTIDPSGIALVGIQALDQKITAIQNQLGMATTTVAQPLIWHDDSGVLDTLGYDAGQIVDGVVHFGQLVADKITATLGVFNNVQVAHDVSSDTSHTGTATVQNLCIGSTCVTEDQLKALLNTNGTASSGQTQNQSTQSVGDSTATTTATSTPTN